MKQKLKTVLIIFSLYYISGIFIGFIGIRLGCADPLYSCPSFREYISDPWFPTNNLFWPLILGDGIDKML